MTMIVVVVVVVTMSNTDNNDPTILTASWLHTPSPNVSTRDTDMAAQTPSINLYHVCGYPSNKPVILKMHFGVS